MEKAVEKITNILNITFEQQVGGGRDRHTEAGVSWSTRYRLARAFQPGFEYWNEFEKLDHRLTYNQQSH